MFLSFHTSFGLFRFVPFYVIFFLLWLCVTSDSFPFISVSFGFGFGFYILLYSINAKSRDKICPKTEKTERFFSLWLELKDTFIEFNRCKNQIFVAFKSLNTLRFVSSSLHCLSIIFFFISFIGDFKCLCNKRKKKLINILFYWF